MNTFFTSDTHFGHANIIKYNSRPFRHVDEMDDELIRLWNGVVGDDDIIYHLGDFTLGSNASKYFCRLNGHIHVLGYPWHHDHRWLPGADGLASKSGHLITIEPPMVVLEFEEYSMNGRPKPVTLCHYPLARWDRSHYGSWHLHGHDHGHYHADEDIPILDVGVDCNMFNPVSIEDVAEFMEGKTALQLNHPRK